MVVVMVNPACAVVIGGPVAFAWVGPVIMASGARVVAGPAARGLGLARLFLWLWLR